jgi:lipid-binding SYLF domain-containing protein
MKLAIVAGLALSTSLLAIDREPARRLGEASSVFSEIMAAPGKSTPQDLLEKAYCIVIVPGVKTGAPPPAAAAPLMALLNAYSWRER